MLTFEPMFDHQVPWLCYRSTHNAHLVYFSCNKCASTFYDAFFERLGWTRCNTQNIDWTQDYVFSYIRNPVVRHRKGIIAAFREFPDMDFLFIGNHARLKFLANVTSIEPHSYSLYRMLGDNAKLVNWIPIDTDLDHRQHTVNLLQSQGEPIDQDTANWLYLAQRANESTPEEVEFYNQLSSITVPPDILRYLDYDICLYDRAVTPAPHLVAGEYYAQRIQELLSLGMSQQQAEQIVDQEVFVSVGNSES